MGSLLHTGKSSVGRAEERTFNPKPSAEYSSISKKACADASSLLSLSIACIDMDQVFMHFLGTPLKIRSSIVSQVRGDHRGRREYGHRVSLGTLCCEIKNRSHSETGVMVCLAMVR